MTSILKNGRHPWRNMGSNPAPRPITTVLTWKASEHFWISTRQLNLETTKPQLNNAHHCSAWLSLLQVRRYQCESRNNSGVVRASQIIMRDPHKRPAWFWNGYMQKKIMKFSSEMSIYQNTYRSKKFTLILLFISLSFRLGNIFSFFFLRLFKNLPILYKQSFRLNQTLSSFEYKASKCQIARRRQVF